MRNLADLFIKIQVVEKNVVVAVIELRIFAKFLVFDILNQVNLAVFSNGTSG